MEAPQRETLHLFSFFFSWLRWANIGVERIEECTDRVKADVWDTCPHGAVWGGWVEGGVGLCPRGRANSNIAQALGKKDSLKNMINGEPGVFQ